MSEKPALPEVCIEPCPNCSYPHACVAFPDGRKSHHFFSKMMALRIIDRLEACGHIRPSDAFRLIEQLEGTKLPQERSIGDVECSDQDLIITDKKGRPKHQLHLV